MSVHSSLVLLSQALRADRHYQRQLLLSALFALRQATTTAAAAWKCSLVLDSRRCFLQLGACLQAWHRAAQRLARLGRCQRLLVRGRATRLRRAVLKAWRERCLLGAEDRRMKVKVRLQGPTIIHCLLLQRFRSQLICPFCQVPAAQAYCYLSAYCSSTPPLLRLQSWYFYAFITLSKAMREWRRAAVAKAASGACKARAEAHARRSRLAMCVAAWKQRARELKERTQSIDAAERHGRWVPDPGS